MNHYHGCCACGAARFDLWVPRSLSTYAARACDCDFCVARGASYLSDPEGHLALAFTTEPLVLRQGSEQAEFLQCPDCSVLIGVVMREGGANYGAINVGVSPVFDCLQAAQVVSPKLLAAGEKTARWRDVWSPTEISANAD